MREIHHLEVRQNEHVLKGAVPRIMRDESLDEARVDVGGRWCVARRAGDRIRIVTEGRGRVLMDVEVGSRQRGEGKG